MRWFTSDLHFNHLNVIKYCNRPFPHSEAGVQEMNETLIRNWNELVKPDDDVFVIGDFSLSRTPVELFTRQLVGRKHLVAGNHDWCHPANRKVKTPERLAEFTKFYLDNGWETVMLEGIVAFPGTFNARMYHLPYREDVIEGDKAQNHPQYRIEDDGRPLICGHVHEKWKSRLTARGTPMLNVGVDVWQMRPVSEAEVVEEISRLIREGVK